MSTKAQLRDAIKRESRIKSSTNLDQMVDDIVADILRDYCYKSRYYQLLQEGVALTIGTAGLQSYSLPTNFQNIDTIRYGRGPNPTAFIELFPQPATVRQTWSDAIPRYYRLIAGNQISLWPFGQIAIQDQLILDYYLDPATVFVLDTDNFPIPNLESVVKKAAIARVQRFHAADQESMMTEGDSKASFIAGQSASK